MNTNEFYRRSSDIKIRYAEASRNVVAALFQVPANQLMAKTRCNASIALARQSAMYLCHVVASINLSETARLFCRDRTTVSHACRIIEDRRDSAHFDDLIELSEMRFRRELERIQIADAIDSQMESFFFFPKKPGTRWHRPKLQ